MFFLTVGTQKFQFNRLLSELDNYIANSSETAFGQIGYSNYRPRNFPYKEFLSAKEFEYYLSNCEVVITHSGVATIIKALKFHKPVIVIPRLKKYGEHVDNHQNQIAEMFSERNLVLWGKDGDKIEDLIIRARNTKFEEFVSNQNEFVNTIENYLQTIHK